MSEQTPSMGRVVIYKHHGSADGKYPPITSPAIIQNVETKDDEVGCDLFVMSNTGGIFFPKGVKRGDNPGEWNWPERV